MNIEAIIKRNEGRRRRSGRVYTLVVTLAAEQATQLHLLIERLHWDANRIVSTSLNVLSIALQVEGKKAGKKTAGKTSMPQKVSAKRLIGKDLE